MVENDFAGRRLGSGKAAASSAYATIQDEGVALTQRTKLNFIGAGVTAADNAGTTTTDVTIPGGGGAGDYDILNVDMTTHTVTGVIAETTVISYTLPGGTLGINDGLQILIWLGSSGNVNTKICRIYFGATVITNHVVSGSASEIPIIYWDIHNCGAVNSQRMGLFWNPNSGSTYADYATSAINTANDVTIKVTAELDGAGDTISSKMWRVAKLIV